ncbi:MAG: ABC transporter permease [Pseudomonadales bacterium]
MLILKLAFRNILRQRRRSLLTGLSMAGGYILTVLSLSMLEGSYNNVIDIFTLDHTSHIQIHKDNYMRRPKIYKSITGADELELILSEHQQVHSFSPRVFAPALAYAGNKSSMARVFGVDVMREPTVSRLAEKIQSGSYFEAAANADGYFQTMIGQGIADSLNLSVGEEIILISSSADGSIANDIFVVSAIVGNKTSYDRLGVYLPLNAAQMYLSMGDRVHEYAIIVEDKTDNLEIAAELRNLLPDLTVSPWQEVEETFFQSMQADKQGNYFSMGIIIFIVFIGVLNTVLMSVLERTREFGVLRAIGSRPFEIVKMVFLETTFLSSISIAIGFICSLPLIIWFNSVGILLPEPIDMGGIEFQHMKGEFSLLVFAAPAILILGFAAAVSLPPGIRASRILPRDALGSH